VQAIRLPGDPDGPNSYDELAFGAGSVWDLRTRAKRLDRLDPHDGSLQAAEVIGDGPFDLTFAAGSAWVVNNEDGTLTRVDGVTNKVTTIPVGPRPIDIAGNDHDVWVSGVGDIALRIDPTGRRSYQAMQVFGVTESFLAVGRDGSVWFNVNPKGISPTTRGAAVTHLRATR